MVGLLVQLGIEGHHTPVGVLELAVESSQILFAGAQLLERAQQLLVLELNFFHGSPRALPGQGADDVAHPLRGDHGDVTRNDLRQRDGRPVAGLGRDHEVVHQAPGADDADPHAGRRGVAPAQDPRQIRDPRAVIEHLDREELRRRPTLHSELDAAAAGVGEGIASDLGDRGGDSRLVPGVETEQPRDLACPLARRDDVVLVLDGHRQDQAHLATTTVTSSRRRAKSR